MQETNAKLSKVVAQRLRTNQLLRALVEAEEPSHKETAPVKAKETLKV